jgi:hypothetical protein
MAATLVLGEQQKVTAVIRTDKSANFPPLPKEADSVKA